MVDRLVLGSGSLVQTVVSALREKPGTVYVGTDDRTLATTFREVGVDAETLDPTDETALADLDPDLVFVLQDSPQDSHAAARAVKNALPEAYLLVYAGEGDRSHGTALEGIADRVVDPGRATAARLIDQIGENGKQLKQLWRVLSGIDRLAIVAHDNPDPDAIASGVALAELAGSAGCETEVCYYGTISHQENRAFVNVLDLDLRNVEAGETLSEFDGIALVDHSRPGVNDQLSPDTDVDIVIDHHPPRAPVDAQFVDLRSRIGATSTLLVEYLDRFGMNIKENIATALLFGIHVDTRSFAREVSVADFEAAATLLPSANLATLERIESPSVSAQTLETMANAISYRQVEDGVLLSFVGHLSERDALAQAADRLLTLEGISTTLVYGVMDETVYASARSSDPQLDIGETLREVFDHLGSAGGHADMGGAQFDLGVFGAIEDDDDSLREVIEASITGPFLEAAEASTGPGAGDVYTGTVVTERYVVEPPVLPGSDESASDDSHSDASDDDGGQTQEETRENGAG
jgi:nanoRNase/pAp phosphatase (c-di-AMP/oligoRNAs hydrolase)